MRMNSIYGFINYLYHTIVCARLKIDMFFLLCQLRKLKKENERLKRKVKGNESNAKR